MQPREKIVKFLKARADAFWVDSAMNYIGRGLATNNTFVTKVTAQRATIKAGSVRSYRASVKVSDATGTLHDGRLTYTLNPANARSHTVKLTLIEAN